MRGPQKTQLIYNKQNTTENKKTVADSKQNHNWEISRIKLIDTELVFMFVSEQKKKFRRISAKK